MDAYLVLEPIRAHGRRHQPGATVELSDRDARPLLDARPPFIRPAETAPGGNETAATQPDTQKSAAPSPEGTGEKAPAADASAAGLAGDEPGAAKRTRKK
jgi:hypothetical protein